MRKGILYTLWLAGVFLSNKAYSQKYDEVVYLKNGTVIKGMIIEFIPDKSIKIQSKDDNIFFYRIDEIEKVTRELSNLDQITINNKIIKQKGFTNTTDLGFSMDLERNEKYVYSIHNISGYLFNPFFSMGIGIGVDKYRDFALMPVFFDVHTYFSNSIVAPFFSFNIGRSYGSGDKKGGAIFNPSLGVKAFMSAKTAMDVSIGYKMQEMEYKEYSYQYTRSFELITFKMGFTF